MNSEEPIFKYVIWEDGKWIDTKWELELWDKINEDKYGPPPHFDEDDLITYWEI